MHVLYGRNSIIRSRHSPKARWLHWIFLYFKHVNCALLCSRVECNALLLGSVPGSQTTSQMTYTSVNKPFSFFTRTRVHTDSKNCFPGLSRTCKDQSPGFSRTHKTHLQGLSRINSVHKHGCIRSKKCTYQISNRCITVNKPKCNKNI